ncbi:pentapeptide repeat-containing protein [Primorskyibacter flagellatus]|jgi:uncharacterized protein YjbI with pentapeptide repeats|uniref:pentapeptide repeat-containing protein n=1 Tax=Primorskyibacter flagellatus TaxID=1387277 RepID=UPI003A926555
MKKNLFGAVAALAVATAAQAEQSNTQRLQAAATTYPIIVDTETPREGPLVIDGCELKPGADCPGVDLSHADLRGVKLMGANLRGAKLTRANLYNATLKGADFSGADLRGATLTKSHMQGMTARGADFTGANMDFSRLAGAHFQGANLTAISMEASWAPKIRLVGATIKASNLQESKFYDADLGEAVMEGNNIRYAIWEGAHMENCTGCPFDW